MSTNPDEKQIELPTEETLRHRTPSSADADMGLGFDVGEGDERIDSDTTSAGDDVLEANIPQSRDVGTPMRGAMPPTRNP